MLPRLPSYPPIVEEEFDLHQVVTNAQAESLDDRVGSDIRWDPYILHGLVVPESLRTIALCIRVRILDEMGNTMDGIGQK